MRVGIFQLRLRSWLMIIHSHVWHSSLKNLYQTKKWGNGKSLIRYGFGAVVWIYFGLVSYKTYRQLWASAAY